MNKKKFVITFIFILLVIQVLGFQLGLSRISFAEGVSASKKNEKMTFNQFFEPKATRALSGTEIVKSNVLEYGNMEKAQPSGEPEGFDIFSVHGTNHMNNSYQDEVHSGTYSGYISCKGTEQQAANFYNSRNFNQITELPYLDENITMDLWYNAKENPHFAQGAEQFIRLRFRSISVGYYYIYYYTSRASNLPSNSTSSGYYDIRSSLNTWIHVNRNITRDFEAVFPTVDLDSTYIQYLFFYLTSIENPSGPTIMLYDDVSFTNGSAFEYFSNNGDFELGDGSYWSIYETGPGWLYTTDSDSTEGNRAMNLSALCTSTIASSTMSASSMIYDGWNSVPKSWSSQQPEDVVISFDWKYSDTPGLGQQNAHFRILAANSTFTFYLYFIFGIENDDLLSFYSNYSYSTYALYYIAAENFGVRDTWNHFSFDLYEIENYFNITNVVPYNCIFSLNNNYVENNFNQLLIDDFQIVTYPAGDPSFEGNIYETTSDPFNFWVSSTSHLYANITTDAYDGNYAANLTAYNNIHNINIYKNTFLPVVDNLFTDFYWRLDQLTENADGASSYIRLEVDNSNYLYYLLGNNSYFNPVNDTDECYYLVKGHNQKGTWNNLIRNLNEDITAYFGGERHNITQIYLENYAVGTENVTTIFDYIHFVRDIAGPTITNPTLTPIAPEYNETVTISVEVEDNIEISVVELLVKIDDGAFTATPMTWLSGKYTATIAAKTFGTNVAYYFRATDTNGHQSQLGTELAPYSYTVADTVKPTLLYEVPAESQILSGKILFNFTDAYDLGSGLQSFELLINGTVVYTNSSTPENYLWDTETFENGEYSVVFRLTDNAGNTAEESFTYTVYNPPTDGEAPIAFSRSPLAIFLYSASGALILGAVIFTVVFKVRRRKKLASS